MGSWYGECHTILFFIDFVVFQKKTPLGCRHNVRFHYLKDSEIFVCVSKSCACMFFEINSNSFTKMLSTEYFLLRRSSLLGQFCHC